MTHTRCHEFSQLNNSEYLMPLCRGEYIDFVVGPYLDTVGALFYVFVVAAWLLPLWMHSESVALPAVGLTLLGGFFFVALPGMFSWLGILLSIIGGIALPIYLLYQDAGAVK